MSEAELHDERDTAPDTQINHEASLKYWNTISPDVGGMLGGYPQVSTIDLRGSQNFLAKLRRLSPSSSPTKTKLARAVDCGAGIGRVTEGFLSKVSAVVDSVEPVEKFATVLQNGELKKAGVVGDVFVQGLEQWTPRESTYDLIWNQWCVGHLTDRQLIEYLERCGKGLREGGWIVVKENLSTHQYGADIFDDEDSSVTRSDRKFRELFAQANLEVIRAELQTGFPKGLGLYPVKMYALRPKL